MDTAPIESTSSYFGKFLIRPKIASDNIIHTISKIGEVQSGVQRFEWKDPPEGTYYFLVITKNEYGLQSSIIPEISATTTGVSVTYNPLANLDFGLLMMLIVILAVFGALIWGSYYSLTKKKSARVQYRPKPPSTPILTTEKDKRLQKEFNEILAISTTKKGHARELAHHEKFHAAFIYLDETVQRLEDSLKNPEFRRFHPKIQKRLANLKPERDDYQELSSFEKISQNESLVTQLFQNDEFSKANTTIESVLQDLKVFKQITNKYNISTATTKIIEKEKEFNELRDRIIKQYKKDIASSNTPINALEAAKKYGIHTSEVSPIIHAMESTGQFDGIIQDNVFFPSSHIEKISSFIFKERNGSISNLLNEFQIDLRIVNKIVNNLLHSYPSLFTVYINPNQDIFALISLEE